MALVTGEGVTFSCLTGHLRIPERANASKGPSGSGNGRGTPWRLLNEYRRLYSGLGVFARRSAATAGAGSLLAGVCARGGGSGPIRANWRPASVVPAGPSTTTRILGIMPDYRPLRDSSIRLRRSPQTEVGPCLERDRGPVQFASVLMGPVFAKGNQTPKYGEVGGIRRAYRRRLRDFGTQNFFAPACWPTAPPGSPYYPQRAFHGVLKRWPYSVSRIDVGRRDREARLQLAGPWAA